MLINDQLRNQNGFGFALEMMVAAILILGVVTTAIIIQKQQDSQAKKTQLAEIKKENASNTLPPGTYVINSQPNSTTTNKTSTNTPQRVVATVKPESSSATTKTSYQTPALPPAIVHPTIANCGSPFIAYASVSSGSAVYQGSNSSYVIQTIPFGSPVTVICYANNSPWVSEEASPYGSMLYGELSLTQP